LRQENKSLKDQVGNKKDVVRAAEQSQSEEGSVQISASNYAELSALSAAVRHLRQENAKLKGMHARQTLDTQFQQKLLPISKWPSNNLETIPTEPKAEQPDLDSNLADTVMCFKDLSNLIQNLQTMRATAKVVDLTPTNTSPNSNSEIKNSLSPLLQLDAQYDVIESIQQKANNLKLRVASTISKQGGAVNSEARKEFANFPSAVQIQTLKDLKPKLIGRVCIPSDQVPHTPTQLLINNTQFMQIHSTFVR